MQSGDFVEITGEFYQHQQYGLDARHWTIAPANGRGTGQSFARRRRSSARSRRPIGNSSSRPPPRSAIRGSTRSAPSSLRNTATRFRNTAGARTYHHARRGGLLEHTAQMMRVATQIAPLYPDSQSRSARRRDSLSRCRQALGKLSARNRFQHAVRRAGRDGRPHRHRDGVGQFALAQTRDGRARRPNGRSSLRRWKIAGCICFISIASHHGEPQFGSPIYPKTPEASPSITSIISTRASK